MHQSLYFSNFHIFIIKIVDSSNYTLPFHSIYQNKVDQNKPIIQPASNFGYPDAQQQMNDSHFPSNMHIFNTSLSVFANGLRHKCRSASQMRTDPIIINSSITKYRSIRELKKLEQRQISRPLNKKSSTSFEGPFKKDIPPSFLEKCELMGIIKLKLNDNDRHLRIKTESGVVKNESKQFINHFQVKEHLINRSINIQQGKNKKQVDLVIRNSRGVVSPDCKKSHGNGQLVVKLKERPFTGIKPPIFSRLIKSGKRYESKPHLITTTSFEPSLRRQEKPKEKEPEPINDLSAWEIKSIESDTFLSPKEGKKRRIRCKRK